MTTCISIVPGCDACAAEPLERGHECDDLCRLTRDMKQSPETHRMIHEPQRCNACGSVIDDKRGNDRIVVGTCPGGTCRIWACPDCGSEVASDGPVVCPVCSPVESEFAEHVRVAEERMADWTARDSRR
jgi:hypothetical protein